jgi:hypothetical protein
MAEWPKPVMGRTNDPTMNQVWMPLPPGGLHDPIRRLWVEGNGEKRIAAKMGIAVVKVRRIVNSLGLQRFERLKPVSHSTGRTPTEKERASISALFQQGYGYKAIAKQLSIPKTTVWRTCLALGLRQTSRSGKTWLSPAYVPPPKKPKVPNPTKLQAATFHAEQYRVRLNDNHWARHPEVLRWQAWHKMKADPVAYRRLLDRVNARIKLREKTDPRFLVLRRLRRRLWFYTKKGLRLHIEDLVGCSRNELKDHLERRFKPGMTWENYGVNGWQIDHVKPCIGFDLLDPHQQRLCFHFSNLRPMWAKENISKSDRVAKGIRARSIPIQLGLRIDERCA